MNSWAIPLAANDIEWSTEWQFRFFHPLYRVLVEAFVENFILEITGNLDADLL
jgi:hypothetical protein